MTETEMIARIEHLETQLAAERAHARKWEKRAKAHAAEKDTMFHRAETWRRRAQNNAAQRDAYRADGEKWHTRAVSNLAVMRAQEKTIQQYLSSIPTHEGNK